MLLSLPLIAAHFMHPDSTHSRSRYTPASSDRLCCMQGGFVSIEPWLGFVAASAVLLVIPGPTILTVISYSTAHGKRANVPLVAAVALGNSTALVLLWTRCWRLLLSGSP
jgi:hypothetical protein